MISIRHSKSFAGSPIHRTALARDETSHAVALLRQPFELLGLALLSSCYLLIYWVGNERDSHILNIAGPSVLATILFLAAFRMAKANALTIWAPLFWFRIACAVYYGLGSIIPNIVNYETLEHIFNLHQFSSLLHLKINLIYTLGILITLSAAHLLLPRSHTLRKNFSRNRLGSNREKAIFFGFAFLILGGTIRYGLVVPYTFGVWDVTLPGVFLTVGKFYYAGLYLLLLQAIGPGGRLRFLTLLLLFLEVGVSVASFAKTELLLVLIFAVLAFLSHKISLYRAAVSALCLFSVYFAFQPMVKYGRAELASRYEEIRGAGLNERLRIVNDYLRGAGSSGGGGDRQRGLSRLSYVNIAAFVVDRYDSGYPGHTFKNALAVLVPRVLWPDKPIITQLGTDLNYTVFRSDSSSLGVGHFAEAYWNFGWVGLGLLMLPLAAILTFFSRYSINAMANEEWFYLPIVFLGVNVGVRVDGHFVPDVIGAAWMAVILGSGLYLLRSFNRYSLRLAGGRAN